MLCPRCQRDALQSRDYLNGRLRLERCAVCLGTWFEAGLLREALQEASAHVVLVPADSPDSDCVCPECNLHLLEFAYPSTDVSVHLCVECEGCWLDKGGFVQLRLQRKAAKRSVGLRSKLLGGFFKKKRGR
jgi:Zn-finger nucleic acid-binding protein